MIYTVSDLSRKRREVADVVRRGLARIRDTDGTGLVLMPARRYEVLEAVSRWVDRLGVVERTLTKSRGRYHGAMTYHAIQAIAQASYQLTYAELHEQLLALIDEAQYNQHPRLEGTAQNKQRQIFT